MVDVLLGNYTSLLLNYEHDTHNATHFHCDITAISHRVQADTLDANLPVKITHANENPLYICGETVHMFFS